VLPHNGLPVIAYKRPLTGGMRHQVCDTIEDAYAFLQDGQPKVYDYYFGISTLVEASVDDNGTKRVRTQANSSHTRCFVLDIDIHPPGHPKHEPGRFYESQEEGREGLQRLIEKLGMPQPIVVNSGYGLHVYWPMMEGVKSSEWTVVAQKFKRVISLLEPQIVGDGSRVSDSAGVLRVPETYNLKNGTRVLVQIEQWYDDELDFGEFAKMLQTYGGAGLSGNKPTKAVPSVSLDIERDEMQPVALKQLVRNCNWVSSYLKDPEGVGEPGWYAVLGLAPYVTAVGKQGQTLTGEVIAHAFSKGHSEYQPAETEKKYLQAVRGQTGPTTCARLQDDRRDWCVGCPFLGAVKSPVSAARLSRPITEPLAVETAVHGAEGAITQETVMIPVPPAPYFRGEDGGVFTRLKIKDDETGEWSEVITKVYDYDLYPTKRFRTENIETEVLEVRLHLPRDGMRTFKMPTENLADQKKLASFLVGRGVLPEYGQVKFIAKYFVDYVRSMQVDYSAETEFSRFGWRDVTTKDPKFVVGNGYISAADPLVAGSFAHFLKAPSMAVAAAGELDAWKKAFNVYTKVPDTEAYQIAALLGFAAPLLALTEYSGVLYNMVGPSGIGKSTALKIMSSVWGQPSEKHLQHTDNEIPMYNMLGYLNSVPVAFDEMTKMEPDRLGNFVLNFTGGRGKMRATRTGHNAINETTWDTIVAASSNTSLYTKLAEARLGYNAEAMRVYEVTVDKLEGATQFKPMLDEAMAQLRKNYGVAGRVFMEYVVKHVPTIRELMVKAMAKIDAEQQRGTDERFWVAFLAAIRVGGTIAKRLGLHEYDVEALVAWASGQTVEVREEVEQSHASPLQILGDYFNNTIDGTLYFREGAINLDGPSMQIRTIKNRVEFKGARAHEAWLSVSAMREYCQHKRIDMAWLKRGLEDAGILTGTNIMKRLAAGTNLPNTPTRVWQIDMNHPSLAMDPPESKTP